ncbi:hypothetical protein WH47_02970 [Habropoda laboriosa]|uniref:Uncharacterized protein n=1 Tax=Habropoda laboriosa TaxID=597456 RepID=A0A0L7QST6_9HYME|nr:hypothetical protein WH47_02970 [Habropoda laboriosa]
MKLRTFQVLYYLCVLCTFVQSESISRSSPSLSARGTQGTLNANIPRDKRALGLILSGLAQVFGYTVNPVQIASLPNPTSEDEARATPNNNQQPPNSTESSGSSTAATPKQRETIRFTGVLNFGNSTGLLGHLQQYERIFHRQNGSSNSTAQTPTSSIAPPQLDPRTSISNQSTQPPFLLKIPLPNVAEPPLPVVPQSPLPEIPPQDIQLSYPGPLVPVRKEQQPVYRKNESTERTTVESEEIKSGKEVQSAAPPNEEPEWKKEHEERLSELERRQEEQAHQLRQQEWYRNGGKDDNYSGEEIRHGNNDCGNEEKENLKGDRSEEEEDRYESGERIAEYPTTQKTTNAEEDSYRNYKDEDYKYKQYEDTPETSENYTGIQYSEPLPLSDDDEQRRPEELRNSYGELLGNRELFDEGFLNYFSKFKEPLSDFYSSFAPRGSKEVEDSRGKEEDRSGEKIREEDESPARNKYEEYSLEEDTRRKDGEGSNEDTSEPSLRYSNNISSNGKNRSYLEERRTSEETDFSKYMPLVVPVRYLDAPEELKKAKSRLFTSEKSSKDNNGPKAEATKKVSFKEPYRPKKENLKAMVNPSERHTPKKLHEGEEKELQVWPPPFDFVLDGIIHANGVPVKSSNNSGIKVSNIRRKPDKDTRQQRGRRVTFDSSTEKSRDTSENIDRLKKDLERGKVSEKRQMLLNRPVNAKRDNRTPVKIEEMKSDRRKEEPEFWKRYKYTLNNNYKNTERPNIEIQRQVQVQAPDSLNLKKLEFLKPTEKSEVIVENDYTELYPERNKNSQVREKSESMTTFDPVKNYNYFDFDENPYRFNYGTEKLSGDFEVSGKMEGEGAIGLAMPQEDVYRYDESLTKFASEPESRNEKVQGRDYGNAASTDKREEMQRRSELETKMAEILENLKTRLLVE